MREYHAPGAPSRRLHRHELVVGLGEQLRGSTFRDAAVRAFDANRKWAERMRADAQVGPPGRPDNHRIAPPPERLGPPTASTETDAAGCFETELPPGDYVLGHPELVGYVAFTVATGKRTGCGHSTGYRFSRWSCGAPE